LPVFVDRLCDNEYDCPDGSDENDAMYQCKKGKFKTQISKNETVIPERGSISPKVFLARKLDNIGYFRRYWHFVDMETNK
jgi:hypothetical protein